MGQVYLWYVYPATHANPSINDLREPSVGYTIVFKSRGKIHIKGHPNNTRHLPDIVALREYAGRVSGEPALWWGHLEATGEQRFEKCETQSDARAASYTTHHLQTRPDLRMALGISVKKEYCKLFASTADGIYQTGRIVWKDIGVKDYRLLCAWMWRLYAPDTDPSLTIDYKMDGPPTFTLSQNGKQYSELFVMFAGESIGRRTIVMGREDDELVIKEQYIKQGRQSMEKEILKKIHGDGASPFPGVVSLAPSSLPSSSAIFVTDIRGKNSRQVTRNKIRLLLNERGNRLLEVKTPKEVLMLLYDALEGE